MSEAWPVELKLTDSGRLLKITFDDGTRHYLPAELLRVESPSAEVRGHGPGQEQLVTGKRNVRISKLEPVGTYAIRIVFDDGHNSGLFTWAFLSELGAGKDAVWNRYIEKLQHAGKSRD